MEIEGQCLSYFHDVCSDRIAWFTHRTKLDKDSNWQGTSSGAEGDMLTETLGKVKEQGFCINQLVMDHDTSANAIVCSHFPDVHIMYCGNHTAKSFHYELGKIKALKYKCKTQGIPCKRITEAFIDRVKCALKNLMSCAEVIEHSEPLEAFSEGLLNFYNHYCKSCMLLSGANFIQRQMMMVASTPRSLHYFALYSLNRLKKCSSLWLIRLRSILLPLAK